MLTWVENDFTSDEALNSVTIMTSVLTAGTALPAKIASKIAANIYKYGYKFVNGTVYFTVKEHTTMVLLDGEFAYYEIDTYVYTYADEDRTEQITSDFYSGESLSPAKLDNELLLEY